MRSRSAPTSPIRSSDRRSSPNLSGVVSTSCLNAVNRGRATVAIPRRLSLRLLPCSLRALSPSPTLYRTLWLPLSQPPLIAFLGACCRRTQRGAIATARRRSSPREGTSACRQRRLRSRQRRVECPPARRRLGVVWHGLEDE